MFYFLTLEQRVAIHVVAAKSSRVPGFIQIVMAGFEYGSFYTDEVIMARVMAYTENCQSIDIPISSYIHCGTLQEVAALYQIQCHVEDKSDGYYWNEAVKATIPVSGSIDDLDGGETLELKKAQEYTIRSGELKGLSHVSGRRIVSSI